MNVCVTRVTLESFIHNTERKDRVLAAIQHCVNEEEDGNYSTNSIQGHFGNEVIFLEYRAKEPKKALEFLIRKLSSNYTIESIANIFLHDKKLFLRLDKQAAYLNEFSLKDGGDIIKIKVRFTGTQSEIPDFLKNLGKKSRIKNKT